MDIRAAREKIGVTQEDFAHMIGVTVATISRWENGKGKPHKTFIKAIEKLVAKKEKP